MSKLPGIGTIFMHKIGYGIPRGMEAQSNSRPSPSQSRQGASDFPKPHIITASGLALALGAWVKRNREQGLGGAVKAPKVIWSKGCTHQRCGRPLLHRQRATPLVRAVPCLRYIISPSHHLPIPSTPRRLLKLK